MTRSEYDTETKNSMNINEIPDYILRAKPMTAGELKKAIHNLPKDTPVYIVVDKISPDAWDDEKQQWRYAIPLAYATRERIYTEEGVELNLLLDYENP